MDGISKAFRFFFLFSFLLSLPMLFSRSFSFSSCSFVRSFARSVFSLLIFLYRCYAFCVKRQSEHTGAHTFHILQIIYDILKRTSPFFVHGLLLLLLLLLLHFSQHSLTLDCLLARSLVSLFPTFCAIIGVFCRIYYIIISLMCAFSSSSSLHCQLPQQHCTLASVRLFSLSLCHFLTLSPPLSVSRSLSLYLSFHISIELELIRALRETALTSAHKCMMCMDIRICGLTNPMYVLFRLIQIPFCALYFHLVHRIFNLPTCLTFLYAGMGVRIFNRKMRKRESRQNGHHRNEIKQRC